MADPHPSRYPKGADKYTHQADKRSLFERLVEFVSPGPDSKDELIETLADAEHRELIAPESRMMLEGVIRMADLTAGDAMVAAPRMDVLDIDAPYDELLWMVIDTGHSRFPVFEGKRENIIGTLMAKDLLKLQRAPELNLRTLLRPAVFVPESKGLNDLLRDFRANRNHLAMVIDEFGNTAGLITIEDVLEEIVGEIEDEHDEDPEELIVPLGDNMWDLDARAELDDIAELIAPPLAEVEEAVDTIGGLAFVLAGQVPEVGAVLIDPSGWRIEVTAADDTHATRLRLHPPAANEESAE